MVFERKTQRWIYTVAVWATALSMLGILAVFGLSFDTVIVWGIQVKHILAAVLGWLGYQLITGKLV